MTGENDGNKTEEVENLLQKLDKRLEKGEISKETYNKASERLREKLKEEKKSRSEAKTSKEEKITKETDDTDSEDSNSNYGYWEKTAIFAVFLLIFLVAFYVVFYYTQPEPLTDFRSDMEDKTGDVMFDGEGKALGHTDIVKATVYEEEDIMKIEVEMKEEIPDELSVNSEYLLMARIRTGELDYTFNWGVSFGEHISDIFDHEKVKYKEKNWGGKKQNSTFLFQIPLSTIEDPTELIEWQIICGYSEKSPNKVTAMDWLPDNEFITAAKAE